MTRPLVTNPPPPEPILAVSIEELSNLQKQIANGTLSAFEAMSKAHRLNHEVLLDRLITQDPEMLRAKAQIIDIRHKTNNNCSVLITGPSGTGKEILARGLLHGDTPFVAVNCAALPRDLIASLFFGHVKGSFSGAVETTTGYLVRAAKGIIFLDEIADFPLEHQGTLLRAIQERVVSRVGSIEEQKIECRFVGATKENLRELVKARKFREDLFARLMTFEIKTTPLSMRLDDIPLIAKNGIGIDGEIMDYEEPLEIEEEDLTFYNVRAIQNYVQRAKTFNISN